MGDRYERLRELEAKATEGPWVVPTGGTGTGISQDDARNTYVASAHWAQGDLAQANAAFIAEARNKVRALLSERDALVEKVAAGRVSRERLREALDRANHAGRAEWQDLYEGNVSPLDLARKAERQAEDALAAALGIEIAEE